MEYDFSSTNNESNKHAGHASGHHLVSIGPKIITVNASSKEDEDGWVLTYIDVITLLLTMFVMLLAYSSQNQYGFQEIQESLKSEINRPAQTQIVNEKQLIQEKIKQFSARLEQKQLTEDVAYHFEQGKLVIQFGEKILFSSAEAALSKGGYDVMAQVLPIFSGSDYTIVIEGHTDNIPISNEKFASNWELSSARSASVVRYLVENNIEPKRLSAVGFADTRPIGDNRTELGRAKNRRVTFSVSYKE